MRFGHPRFGPLLAWMASLTLWAMGPAAASPILLTVDPAQSNLDVTLCMTLTSTECSTDASPVAGSVTIGLDCLTTPTSLTLYDFAFQLTQTLNHHLVFTFFGVPIGTFDSTATNVELSYATPGVPMPPTPLVVDAFAYTGVPANAAGLFNYTTTGTVCSAFQAQGQLCNATIDLSTVPVNPIDLTGTVRVFGRDITVVLDVNASAPLDPTNPGLGSLTMVGTVVATGIAPPPDIATFVGVLIGDLTAPDLVCESDMNLDGVVDGNDVAAYLAALP